MGQVSIYFENFIIYIIYILGGQIAKAYAELIKELWSGQNNYLSPMDFKKIFSSFIRQVQ